MAAVQRYDHTRGTTFATYALYWVRSAVGAASAGHLGALNLPTSRAEQLRAARGVEADLTQQLGRVPDAAELAQALGRSERWTAALLAHAVPQPSGRGHLGAGRAGRGTWSAAAGGRGDCCVTSTPRPAACWSCGTASGTPSR